MVDVNLLIEGKMFKKFISGLIKVYDEAVFVFDNDGLKVNCTDPGNVLMVLARIPRDACEAYAINSDDVKIGVDLKRLYEISKSIKNKDSVTFLVDENAIHLKFGNISYDLQTIDLSTIRKPPKMPELKLKAMAVVSGEEFKKAIECASRISSFSTFVSDDTGFYLESKSELNSIAIKVIFDAIEHNKETAKATYSNTYLSDITKILEKDNIVKFRFSDNYPAWLTFDIDSMVVEYILAPKVEEY